MEVAAPERRVDQRVAAALQAVGLEVVCLQAAALDDEDEPPGELRAGGAELEQVQVAQERRERGGARAQEAAAEDRSA